MAQRDKPKPSIFKTIISPWFICLLATVFYFYDFLLRIMPSIMIHPLMSSYGVNAGQIGLLSAFYYYTYTPLQLPAGVVVDKYSPRIVLTLSCLICAVSAVLFAATHSYFIGCFARALMGIGSAFAFVGALKLAAIWLPENRFALFAGLTSAIGTLGAVTADNVLSHMVYDFGWKHAVYLTGLAGFVLSIVLFLFIKKRPPALLSSTPKTYHSWSNIWQRFGLLAGSFYTWLNGLVGLLLFLPISVFASLWGVDFIARKYHLLTAAAASATSLVFLGVAIASPFIGHLSDKIKSRKIPLFIGSVGCLASSYILIYVSGISISVAYVLLFLIGVFASPQILVFAIAKDLSPLLATGMATAMANCIVTIGAGLYQPLIGYALDYKWNGAKTEFGTPLFSVQDYRFAFGILVISLLICCFLVLLLPNYKTRGKQQKKTPR
ncbi:MFS transporter [Legionella yabuuchiae]|uniref:MFS transporter n=1 Tax=Legionella yabuuchiae TaxID=376727 RepID=UPI001055718D|nr:MFS transporter [Legionella yabuuchiae]